MPGVINHKRLIDIYKNKKANLVVIPSINTQNNEHEGIPVALIEAMAHKIPVISTKTGGIPELLINRETLVKEKSSIILAKAIIEIIKNNNLKETIVKTNFQKVNNDFNVNKVTNELLELIE
jgi:glycosyltransferase involved in cell wall biosynthesis